MSELLRHLRRHHPNGDDIERVFRDRFGVNVQNEDALFLFKYDQIAAKWTEPVTHECRGAIVRYDAGRQDNWHYVSRPFDKFFNLDEGHCPIFAEANFKSALGTLSLLEKADGSCIQLWWDGERSTWRASTLGKITARPPRNSSTPLDEHFFATAALDTEALASMALDTEYTWLFELCLPDTGAVTIYGEARCVLLAARHTESGQWLDANDPRFGALLEPGNVRRPVRHDLTENEITNFTELHRFVERESRRDPEVYGQRPEGFVLYSERAPVAKIKNARYLQHHHIRGGDERIARLMVAEAFVVGTIDDLIGSLRPELRELAEHLQTFVPDMMRATHTMLSDLEGRDPENRKGYAAEVKSRVAPEVQPFFFQHRPAICAGESDLVEKLQIWLVQHRRRLAKRWV